MKLRNKKTGEPGKLVFNNAFDLGAKTAFAIVNIDGDKMGNRILGEYSSLAELNEEWEDYEEPDWEHWFIDIVDDNCISDFEEGFSYDDIERAKEIGNYFETKEEAEQAVKKLKAWKRLKDKGLRFTSFNKLDGLVYGRDTTEYNIKAVIDDKSYEVEEDIELLFGGEE